jgi:hypothetical protein
MPFVSHQRTIRPAPRLFRSLRHWTARAMERKLGYRRYPLSAVLFPAYAVITAISENPPLAATVPVPP